MRLALSASLVPTLEPLLLRSVIVRVRLLSLESANLPPSIRRAPSEAPLLVAVRAAVLSDLAAVRDVLVPVLTGDKTAVPLLETLPALVLGEVVVAEGLLEVGLFAAASTALRGLKATIGAYEGYLPITFTAFGTGCAGSGSRLAAAG